MTLSPCEPLYPDQAQEALDVFDNLRMVDAPGSPYLSEVSLPWIREFVGAIFGSYEEETGRRHIIEYFMLISKKNGKSTDAAGIMLTALILNWRMSAEFIIISPTVEIANNSFKPAADMVRADPELGDLLLVQDHIRTITHRVTGATLKVVAADSDAVSGKKAVGILVDELWLFGKKPNAENMFREAIGGLVSRPEGFVIYLTTQSDEPPAGVFKDKLEYARKVRDGEIDDNRFYPILYEFPKEMIENKEHLLPENFYVTNPNMGRSVDLEYLTRELKKAQDTNQSSVIGFLAKHCNVEVGLNLRSDRWPGADYWEAAASFEIACDLDSLLANCEVVTIGIDGGGLDDLLGLAVVGRHKVTRQWLVWCYAWAHPSVMSRRKEIAARLKDFADAGEMSLVSVIGEDVEELAELVYKVFQSGLLFQVGLDPASIGGVLEAILLKGVPEDKMVAVNQGWRLAASIKTAERKLAEGVLLHEGSALMNWCVGNAKVKLAGNAIVITKQVSGTAKIDPLMAMFNGVSLMALNPPAQNDSYDFDNMVIGG
jgi:phage terminase large subunit-like protein